ncbi:MAG TPA: dephospho-CoA kinase [Gemmatimonadales bacterium]|nr:dephospho-CoA kinase [Gemmatimonadales bacterium]
MTRVIALTGNIASGKSTVARLFEQWGALLFDADATVHRLQQPGEPVLAAMAQRFGPEILDDRGQLDRAAMRRMMLADPTVRRDLEAIVHPAVAERRRALIDAAGRRGDPVVVADIPLLFESDDPGEYDAVVLVDAPEPLRRERLVQIRGIDPGEADRMIAAQLPTAMKRLAADVVIDNDSTLDVLEVRARDAWELLLAK